MYIRICKYIYLCIYDARELNNIQYYKLDTLLCGARTIRTVFRRAGSNRTRIAYHICYADERYIGTYVGIIKVP